MDNQPQVQEVEKKYFGKYTKHDLEVIIFHVALSFSVAGLLAILQEVAKLNFGIYTPYVIMLTNSFGEAVRRWVY